MRKNKNHIRCPKEDKVFYILNGIFLGFLALLIIYPMYYILIVSISSPDLVFAGKVFFIPKGITFKGYAKLFEETNFWRGFLNTILYTVVGTLFSLVLTLPCGWAISREKTPFKKVIMSLLIITMFFSGGMIPYYLLIRDLKLLNNPLVMIIPGAVSAWNLFVCKSFFETTIPIEVLEAAEIDGASKTRTFLQIVLPLSKPIIIVMILFVGVGKYNNYFDSIIFLSGAPQWHSLQYVIYEMIASSESLATGGIETNVEAQQIKELIKYSSIVVSTVPILIIYPFFQKHFSKGLTLGINK